MQYIVFHTELTLHHSAPVVNDTSVLTWEGLWPSLCEQETSLSVLWQIEWNGVEQSFHFVTSWLFRCFWLHLMPSPHTAGMYIMWRKQCWEYLEVERLLSELKNQKLFLVIQGIITKYPQKYSHKQFISSGGTFSRSCSDSKSPVIISPSHTVGSRTYIAPVHSFEQWVWFDWIQRHFV